MESKCYNGSPEPEVYAKEVSEALLSTDFNTLRAIAEEILKSKRRTVRYLPRATAEARLRPAT